MIPVQLQSDKFRFILVGFKSKQPIEKSWSSDEENQYLHSDGFLLQHIKRNKNYGVLTGINDLIVIDCDDERLDAFIRDNLPKTFSVQSGSRKGKHYYYFVKGLGKKILKNNNGEHLGEIQSKGQQIVGSGSVHPNGNPYIVFDDIPIKELEKEALLWSLRDFTQQEVKEESFDWLKEVLKNGKKNQELRVSDVITMTGQGEHPFHGSEGGMNFKVDDNNKTFRCFRHDFTGNAWHLLAMDNGLISCGDSLQGRNDVWKKLFEIAGDKGLIELDEKKSHRNTIVFNDEVVKKEYDSSKEYDNIDDWRKVVKDNFGSLGKISEVCASVIATLLLEDNINPSSIIIEGQPSGEKTTVLSFFDNINNVTLNIDDFTPRSFVSHFTAIGQKDLAANDLLPKIRHRTMIVKELAPLFTKRKEELVDNLGILTKVFDGEGYTKSSGAQGLRGYQGDYLFSFLGATTPIQNHIWNIMGNLGSRFLFYSLDDRDVSVDEVFNSVFSMGNTYKKRLRVVRDATTKFIGNVFSRYGGVRSVVWKGENDCLELKKRLYDYANLITFMRAPLTIWSERSGDGEVNYEFKTPVKERIFRVSALLWNLARAHALLCGRDYINQEDVDLLKHVALSTMPFDRRLLLNLIIVNSGALTTENVAKALNCSERQAQRTKAVVKILGLVESTSLVDGVGSPGELLRLKDEFRWVLS